MFKHLLSKGCVVAASAVLVGALAWGCDRSSAVAADEPKAQTPATAPSYDPSKEPAVTDRIEKPEAEWKKELSPKQYEVLRQKGTERAGTGELLHEHRTGVFRCAGCGNPLFSSDTKFESGTGWPSFWKPIEEERVAVHSDTSHGMTRDEVVCARCEGHLGHVFNDGPQPTGLRYCMNSVSLKFEEAGKSPTTAPEKK